MANTNSTVRLVPHLWYTEHALAAAEFYATHIPNSSVDRVSSIPSETPSGPAGSVEVVEFTLAGQPFMAIAAGPLDPFNHAVSFMLECETQAEIDALWSALGDGGVEEQCGWVRDRWGLCWQIVPRQLQEMMVDPDREAAGRATRAMLDMVKLDIDTIEAAFRGD